MFLVEEVVVPPHLPLILTMLAGVTLIFHLLGKLQLSGCRSLEESSCECAERLVDWLVGNFGKGHFEKQDHQFALLMPLFYQSRSRLSCHLFLSLLLFHDIEIRMD